MKTYQVDIVGGLNDSQWHGIVDAEDTLTAGSIANTVAKEQGFVRSRYTETYLTLVTA